MKWLFLAIGDEFLTLIFLRSGSGNEYKSAAQANRQARQKNQKLNLKRVASRNFEDGISHEERPEEKWGKPSKIEVGQFILAVLTFAIGLILAGIYFRQMQANRRQAEAAERQLKEMHEDFIADQRAWVVNDYAGIDLPYSPQHIGMRVAFINSGKTPALIYKIEFMVQRFDTTSKQTSIILDTNLPAGFIISPNRNYLVFPNEMKPPGDAEFAFLNDKKVEHHFWFKIQYRDIFGEIIHHSDIGFKITGHASDTNGEGIVIQGVENGERMD